MRIISPYYILPESEPKHNFLTRSAAGTDAESGRLPDHLSGGGKVVHKSTPRNGISFEKEKGFGVVKKQKAAL